MRKNLKNLLLTLLIPLLYLAGPVIIFYTQAQFSPSPVVQVLGLILAFLGLILWFGGYFSLGLSSFSILPTPKTLKKKGLYQIFSHPIYFGIFFTFWGLSLATGSKLGLIYTLFLILPLNITRAKLEEKKLRKRFGKAYKDYKKKTIL